MTSSGHFQRAVHTPVKQYEDAHKLAGGMSSDDAAKRLDFVGHNAIPFEPDTWIQAIKDEFFTPFYLYQLMVYMVWCVAAPPAPPLLRNLDILPSMQLKTDLIRPLLQVVV